MVSAMLRLSTPRLELFPCPPAVARIAYGTRRQLETVLSAPVAADWLDSDGRGLMAYYAQWLQIDPSLLGWGLWLIQHRESGVIFGSAGFKGKPNDAGIIEIGYGVSAQFRRQGYTYETATALIGWAWQHPDVHAVIAECLVDNIGSIGVLEKLGMTRNGMQGTYQLWRLDRPPLPG